MRDFDKEAFSNLESLCKLKLTEKEKKEFLDKLKQILNFVKQLQKLNTDNVEACKYVLMDMQNNVFREDNIEECLNRDVFLSNAPDQIAGMIKVPAIFSQN